MNIEQRFSPVNLFILVTLNFFIVAGVLWLYFGVRATRDTVERSSPLSLS